MPVRWPCVLLAWSALWLCAASPTDWVRRGNTAFERGDFAEALALYRRAEAEARDPGLVSYNLAAAHYELGQFAEQAFLFRVEAKRIPTLGANEMLTPELRAWKARIEALPYLPRTWPPHWT